MIARENICGMPEVLPGKKRQHDQEDDDDQYDQSTLVEAAGFIRLLHNLLYDSLFKSPATQTILWDPMPAGSFQQDPAGDTC